MTYSILLRRLVLAGGILGLVPPGDAQNPALQISSLSLTFNAIANGTRPPMQAVTVTSVSSSAIDFALLVDNGAPFTPAPAWLTVTPLLATTPVQIRVAVDPAGLAAGTYIGRIQLTDRKGVALGIIIPVTLQAAGGPPQFDVTPTEVDFTGSVSAGNLQQGILVRSTGPGSISPVSATVVSGFSGLYATVDPCDTICVVNVRAAVGALSPGAHTGLVRITTAAGSTSVDVPVSLFAADHGPFDQLNPSALIFEAIQVSGLSDSRSVSLLNTGDMPSNWSIDVTGGAQWLAVSPSSGTTAPGKSTTLSVSMNLGNQPPGTYSGMIRISSSDPGAVTLYLPAVLRVSLSGTQATPLLSTGGLVLTSQAGAPDSVQQQVTLSAASTTPINFQASPQSSSWLSLVPSRGQASSSPTALTVSAAGINLAPGFYSGLINVGFGTSSVRSLHAGFAVTAQGFVCQPQLSYLTETGIPEGFVVSTGSPTPLEVVLADDCGNPIVNGTVTARFSSGDLGLELLGIGNGHYAQTWTPLHPSDSLPDGNLSIAFQAFAPTLKPASTEVIGTVVARDALPAIASSGVVNSFFPPRGLPFAAGALVQIFGSALASGTAYGTITNGRLSMVVAGASLKIGGLDAPIVYASPSQINAEVPVELQANRQYQMIVNANSAYSNPQPINTVAVQPIIATSLDGKVIAQDVNYSYINAQNPAHARDIIILYLTGMGATNPQVPTGIVAPTPPAVTAIQPQVTIDGVTADVQFSGLAPGFVGLYQVNVRIPAGPRTGDLPLIVSQSGIASNTAIVPVR